MISLKILVRILSLLSHYFFGLCQRRQLLDTNGLYLHAQSLIGLYFSDERHLRHEVDFSREGLRHRNRRRSVWLRSLEIIVRRLSGLDWNICRRRSRSHILSRKYSFRLGKRLRPLLALHLCSCETESLHLIWAQLGHVISLFTRLTLLETRARLCPFLRCKCFYRGIIRD